MVGKSKRAERRERGLRLLAERPGMSDRAVAAAVGCSPTSVGKWRRQTGQRRAETGQPDRQPGVGGNGQSDVGRRARVDTGPKVDSKQTDCLSLGGRDSAESDSPSGLDVADGPACVPCCPCGGEWVSDGEGGRYCQDCGASCPASPSVPHPLAGDDLAETQRVAGGLVRTLWDVRRRAESLPVTRDAVFHEFMRHVGAALVAVQRWTA
jgi:hypothetical protein